MHVGERKKKWERKNYRMLNSENIYILHLYVYCYIALLFVESDRKEIDRLLSKSIHSYIPTPVSPSSLFRADQK